MFTLNHKKETIFLVMLSIMAGLFLASFVNQSKLQSIALSVSPASFLQQLEVPAPTSVPVPTVIPEPEIFLSEEISSDGLKKVTLTTEYSRNKTRIFSLSSQDSNGENLRLIFTKELPENSDIKIPFNSWSPDNKYFFIEEYSPGKTEIRIYSALGELFADGENYLDVTEIFSSRNTGFTFDNATGWGGYSLLVLNTKTANNEQGSSFWFEVPSKAVIQLSTLFL